MASQELERILQTEYKLLTIGMRSEKSTGVLDSVKMSASEPVASSSSPTRAGSRTPSLSAAQGTGSASGVNKGYTLPVPTSPQPAGTGTSVASEIGKTALKLFTSGLGVMPIVSGLAGLFGGGGPPAPPPLVKYAMPQPIQITAANSRSGGFSVAGYGQDGTVRPYGENSGRGGTAPQGSGAQGSASQGSGGASGGQIVVNVQAMDSRSFLDHSSEIAQAVRDAMLNMHALNDVVSEL
jgi:hypothetical protein